MHRCILIICCILSGCGTTPFVDGRVSYQIDPWSDWVLQPEREWTGDQSEVRFNLIGGLSWGSWDCPYIDVMIVGPWDQFFIGCSKTFGKERFYGSLQLMHQVDSRTSDFLNTDEKRWQGHNPFLHFRGGMQFMDKRLRCGLATGKSLFQGAPFEREEGNPDLYWTNVECGYRFTPGNLSDR